MLYSLLITLREGFEIALVVALILAYLKRTENEDRFSYVWLGTFGAAALSLLVALGLELTASELSGAAQEAFEGFAMLFAAGVLTWMVFWMRRQASSLGRDLRERVSVTLEKGSMAALVLLTFTAVAREGLETVLFLFAGSSSQSGSTALYLAGGVAGFAVAAVLGYVVYRGSRVLPMRQFFSVTGIAVIVLGAGLISNGLAELRESGLIASLGARPWDTEGLVASTSTLGKFLHTLFGYDSAPTWGQIAIYWTYLVAGLTAFQLGLGVPKPRAATLPAANGAQGRTLS